MFGFKKSKIVINSQTFEGSSMSVMNGKITIDGETINIGEKEIKIEIMGDLDKLIVGASQSININGNVKDLSVMQGTTSISGNVEDVESTSGSITCGDVGGDIETTSGNITCNNVEGDIETTSGDVTVKGTHKGKIETLSGKININKHEGDIKM